MDTDSPRVRSINAVLVRPSREMVSVTLTTDVAYLAFSGNAASWQFDNISTWDQDQVPQRSLPSTEYGEPHLRYTKQTLTRRGGGWGGWGCEVAAAIVYVSRTGTNFTTEIGRSGCGYLLSRDLGEVPCAAPA